MKVFLDAGLVVMAPSWRGENENPGRFELFYGEVNDLLAALEYVRSLSWVDPDRIYVAGHSTGGTMALLGAMATDGFRASFSIGGAPDLGHVVSDGEGYGNTPYSYRDRKETFLRSPINFTHFIKNPTFHFEGKESLLYVLDARHMEKIAKKKGVPFRAFSIAGGDHFNILHRVKDAIAVQIQKDTGADCNISFRAGELALN